MEMFKFSKSQQSLQLLFTLLLIPRSPPSTKHRIGLFYFDTLHSVTMTFYALISCVNTIHKTCHRVVKISNRGSNKKYGSSRQAVPHSFVALCACFQIAETAKLHRLPSFGHLWGHRDEYWDYVCMEI